MQVKEVKKALFNLLPWIQPSPQASETETEAQSDRPAQPVVMAATYSTRSRKKLPGRRSPAGSR
jgi:hypothetical protein